jgi:hypothetical protein
VFCAKPNLLPNEKTGCRAEQVIINKSISFSNKNRKRDKIIPAEFFQRLSRVYNRIAAETALDSASL